MAIHLLVFRHENINGLPPETLREECALLAQITIHRKKPFREDAPHFTDCLTSIWYLLGRIQQISSVQDIQFPDLTRIGSMPKKLLSWNWKSVLTSTDNLLAGDLIFLKGNSKTFRLVTHLSMAISSEEIFHCSAENKGGRIEKISAVFAKYKFLDEASPVLRYIDPRPEMISLGALFFPKSRESPEFDKNPPFSPSSPSFQSYSIDRSSYSPTISHTEERDSPTASNSYSEMHMDDSTGSPSLMGFNFSSSPINGRASCSFSLSDSPEPELTRFGIRANSPENSSTRTMAIRVCTSSPASPKVGALKVKEEFQPLTTALGHISTSAFNPLLLNGLNQAICNPVTEPSKPFKAPERLPLDENLTVPELRTTIPSALILNKIGRGTKEITLNGEIPPPLAPPSPVIRAGGAGSQLLNQLERDRFDLMANQIDFSF